MNDELEKLRPEVRSALGEMVRADVCRDAVPTDAFDIVRAELLQLSEDAAKFAHAVSLGQRYKQRADEVEAELAALKERIADAPVVACPKTLVHAGNTMQTEFLEYTHERMPGGCNSWAGKRVRLVVGE